MSDKFETFLRTPALDIIVQATQDGQMTKRLPTDHSILVPNYCRYSNHLVAREREVANRRPHNVDCISP